MVQLSTLSPALLAALVFGAALGSAAQEQPSADLGASLAEDPAAATFWDTGAAERRIQQAIAEGLVPGAAFLLMELDTARGSGATTRPGAETGPGPEAAGRAAETPGRASGDAAAEPIRVQERYFGRFHRETRVPIFRAAEWVVAATALAAMEESGISIDDPLIRFFPEIDDLKAGITIRQLLAHTSGLVSSHPCLADRAIDLTSCAASILQAELISTPGTEIRSGGASLQIAARVAEVVAGASWEEVFQARIARPLGLERATFGSSPNPHVAADFRTTLEDYRRLLQHLLAPPADSTTETAWSAAVREALFTRQSGAAKLVYSPYSSAGQPALGLWTSEDGDFLGDSQMGPSLWISSDRSSAVFLLTLAKPSTARDLRRELVPRLAAAFAPEPPSPPASGD